MEFALWTHGAVMQYIEREFGAQLSVRATGEYLRRWGLMPQKPVKRTYGQRLEAVKQWIDQEYPAIERRAKTEGGEIYWGDETALATPRAGPQLRTARQNTGHDGRGRHAREAVDDLHRHQP